MRPEASVVVLRSWWSRWWRWCCWWEWRERAWDTTTTRKIIAFSVKRQNPKRDTTVDGLESPLRSARIASFTVATVASIPLQEEPHHSAITPTTPSSRCRSHLEETVVGQVSNNQPTTWLFPFGMFSDGDSFHLDLNQRHRQRRMRQETVLLQVRRTKKARRRRRKMRWRMKGERMLLWWRWCVFLMTIDVSKATRRKQDRPSCNAFTLGSHRVSCQRLQQTRHAILASHRSSSLLLTNITSINSINSINQLEKRKKKKRREEGRRREEREEETREEKRRFWHWDNQPTKRSEENFDEETTDKLRIQQHRRICESLVSSSMLSYWPLSMMILINSPQGCCYDPSASSPKCYQADPKRTKGLVEEREPC